MNAMPQPIPATADASSGGRLVATDGRTLPLTGASLRADARGGIASVLLEQRFKNPYEEPLRVTYLLPLPADGAVSGFAFRVGDLRVVGEVDRRAAARERFEQALVEGRSAALVEQERSSLFTQEIGNIPPGAEVVAELTIDQRLAWLADGQWEWRFPTAAAPRYQGAPGRVADAPNILVDVADQPLPARMTLALRIRDHLADGRQPESPSHPLRVEAHTGDLQVEFSNLSNERSFDKSEGVPLDRDVVVRWPVSEPRVGLSLDVARPDAAKANGASAFGLLTVVPPRGEARGPAVARDLILLLDTSGSMGGEPLDQARRICGAIVDTLGDGDRLEMIEFGNAPRRWKAEAVAATEKARREAHKWLAALRASGGTEMRSGILEALRPLRAESQRQIVLVTDGLIGFESEIVDEVAHRLPAGSRVHAVGVGSSVNRSLTGPVARAGRGVEVVIALGEDPERAARRLVLRTDAPLVVDVTVEGDALVEQAPRRAPDLFAGAPSLIALKLKPEGGALRVRGRTAAGAFEQAIAVPAAAPSTGSAAVPVLFGREAVEDLELRVAAGERGLDEAIERIGLDFQIATRMTSWVAVSSQATVDPQAPTRSERMPHELPHGMSMEGLGLRPPSGMPMQYAAAGAAMPARMVSLASPPPAPAPTGRATMSLDAKADVRGEAPPPQQPKKAGRLMQGIGRILERFRGDDDADEVTESPAPEEPAREEEVAKQAAPSLRGRIVRRKGRELVIEIVLDADTDWEAPQQVTVATDEGAIDAAVDAGRSTRSGRVKRGATVRLALVLDEESAAPPLEVAWEQNGRHVVVELR